MTSIQNNLTCLYQDAQGNKCKNIVIENNEYCKEHLIFLTKTNISELFYDIVGYIAGIQTKNISPSDKIYDLGIDSLDFMEVMLTFEEFIELQYTNKIKNIIPYGIEPRELSSIISEICAILLNKQIYITEYPKDFFSNIEEYKNTAKNVKKQIETIINSSLYEMHFENMNLDKDNVKELFFNTILTNWIEYVISVRLPNDIEFDNVKVILLTKKCVFYYIFQNKTIEFRRVRYDEFDLKCIYKYNEKNKIINVDAFISIRDINKEESAGFQNFTLGFSSNEGIEQALKFIKVFSSIKDLHDLRK